MSGVVAIKTNPKLWESVKKQIKSGSKGGPKGKWSARKSQLAVKLYKSKGGGYKGKKSANNSLTKWSKQDWGYTCKNKKSRYLPKIVRSHLTKSEKKSENKRKGSKLGKRVSYTRSVKDKMKRFGIY